MTERTESSPVRPFFVVRGVGDDAGYGRVIDRDGRMIVVWQDGFSTPMPSDGECFAAEADARAEYLRRTEVQQ